MGAKRNAYRVLVEKRPLERLRNGWLYNIKVDISEVGWHGMDWIDLVHDRDHWKDLVNMVTKFLVS
jgi:hypothetical protein